MHADGRDRLGHAGEEALAELLPEGFRHNEQSVRIAETLERGTIVAILPDRGDRYLSTGVFPG